MKTDIRDTVASLLTDETVTTAARRDPVVNAICETLRHALERSKTGATTPLRSKGDAKAPPKHAIAEAVIKALQRYPDRGLDDLYARLGHEAIDVALDRLLLDARIDAAKIAEVEARCAVLTDIVRRAAEIDPFGSVSNAAVRDDARAAATAFDEVATREALLLAALRGA